MTNVLQGITVLDLSTGIAGAVAGMFLSDNGAKVNRTTCSDKPSERNNPGFHVWDRGKHKIDIDVCKSLEEFLVHSESSKERILEQSELGKFCEQVKNSDILIENYPPDSCFRPMFDSKFLKLLNSNLIHCSITAYGRNGPMKDSAALDELIMARLGLLSNQPSFREGPVHIIHKLPSIGAGVLAAQGILASVYSREINGKGMTIHTSLMAGALLFTPKVHGSLLELRGGSTVGGGPFYSSFECLDGIWLQLGCVHSGFIKRAADVMGINELMSEPRFGDGLRIRDDKTRNELFNVIRDCIKKFPYSKWAELFEHADVPYAKVSTTEESMNDAQVKENDMVVSSETTTLGTLTTMGLPVKLTFKDNHEYRRKPVKPSEAHSLHLATNSNDDFHECDKNPRPLHGVKVLELANVIAGPMAAKLLAALGADVIKVEPPGGDISRPASTPYFYHLNAYKRSVSVNARLPEGKEVLKRLVSEVDVLVANMRPGATDRLGIGTNALAKLNPDIIETHVTGFGWTGPYSHRPGLDPLAQALIGLQRAQGGPENPPIFLHRIAPTDYLAGALGALGTILALIGRMRNGTHGWMVQTNLLNSAILINSEDFIVYDSKPARVHADKDHYGLSPLHRLYQTANGWIYVVANEDELWTKLCVVLGNVGLLNDSRFSTSVLRTRNADLLSKELEQIFHLEKSDYWVDALKLQNIPCSQVVDEYVKSFFGDSQAIDNNMILEFQHPFVGPYKMSCNLVTFDNTTEEGVKPTPLLGQHTEEVLKQIGYTAADIRGFYDAGVVITEKN